MFDKIHGNDTQSKLDYLNKKNLISPDHSDEINHLLKQGDYSEAEEIIEELFERTLYP